MAGLEHNSAEGSLYIGSFACFPLVVVKLAFPLFRVYLGEGTSFTYEGKTRVIWCSAISACRADRGEILAGFCRDSHLSVVLQVGSNTREIHDDRNVELLKVGFGANTREHKDLRTVECSTGNNDLLSSKDLLLYPRVACEIVSWISAVHAFSGKVFESDSPGEDKDRVFY
jgi:hypothetical protein